jgi:Rrf2 family protein
MSKIISLSEASSIAIHGMILVARSEKPINAVEIAKRTESSRHHVAKVMQRLAKDGFIGSSRGPNGGFFLVKKPDEISLLNLFESIEGKLEPGSCPAEKMVCSFDTCIYNNIIEKMTADFTTFLNTKKLTDYL